MSELVDGSCYVVTMALPQSSTQRDYIVVAKTPIDAIQAAGKFTANRNGQCVKLRRIEGIVVMDAPLNSGRSIMK